MQLSNRQTEEAFSDTIVEAMSAQSQEGAPKITTNDLELAAAEHADDFEEAWSALETARMIFEKSEDHLATAKVRLSLGDACSDVEQWDDAAKEYGQAATILEELEPNGRRTCEALFLWGLALQMLRKSQISISSFKFRGNSPLLFSLSFSKEDRAGCVKAICQARDAMKRLIESLPETADPKEKEEYEGFLVDLSSKADEVLLEATWTNHEEVDRKLAGEDQEDEQEEEEEAESNKRLIDDNDDGEQLESEAEKKRKIAPDSEEPPKE